MPSRVGAPMTRRRLWVRTRIAVRTARLAAGLSRRLRRGEGAIIGGRVAVAVDPQVLERLAAGCRVVLVTGTNGKTTAATCRRGAAHAGAGGAQRHRREHGRRGGRRARWRERGPASQFWRSTSCTSRPCRRGPTGRDGAAQPHPRPARPGTEVRSPRPRRRRALARADRRRRWSPTPTTRWSSGRRRGGGGQRVGRGRRRWAGDAAPAHAAAGPCPPDQRVLGLPVALRAAPPGAGRGTLSDGRFADPVNRFLRRALQLPGEFNWATPRSRWPRRPLWVRPGRAAARDRSGPIGGSPLRRRPAGRAAGDPAAPVKNPPGSRRPCLARAGRVPADRDQCPRCRRRWTLVALGHPVRGLPGRPTVVAGERSADLGVRLATPGGPDTRWETDPVRGLARTPARATSSSSPTTPPSTELWTASVGGKAVSRESAVRGRRAAARSAGHLLRAGATRPSWPSAPAGVGCAPRCSTCCADGEPPPTRRVRPGRRGGCGPGLVRRVRAGRRRFADLLQRSAPAPCPGRLRRAADAGHRCHDSTGHRASGPASLDLTTVPGRRRAVGEVVADVPPPRASRR